ncbi:hypothetical protein D3C87_457060 [compost metagenome]
MKKLFFLLVVIGLFSCDKDDSSPSNCGSHNGKQLHKGPKGGCYYINSNGNKTYVESYECNC